MLKLTLCAALRRSGERRRAEALTGGPEVSMKWTVLCIGDWG